MKPGHSVFRHEYSTHTLVYQEIDEGQGHNSLGGEGDGVRGGEAGGSACQEGAYGGCGTNSPNWDPENRP